MKTREKRLTREEALEKVSREMVAIHLEMTVADAMELAQILQIVHDSAKKGHSPPVWLTLAIPQVAWFIAEKIEKKRYPK